MQKKQSKKSWLKIQHLKNYDHGIQSHHFMANRMGKSRSSGRFYFLGLQITVDCDCTHKIKRRLLLERKVMTNLDSILKNRNITLPKIAHIVKAMVFPIVMQGCEKVTQSCLTLCNPMDCSLLGFPILLHLLELAQTHVHQIGDAIQLYHPLSSPFPPVFNLSLHQDLLK